VVTDKTFDTNWVWAGAVLLFILGAVAAHFSDQLLLRYPIDEWRMDLDDLLGNVGTFFVGLAALIALRRAHRKIDANGTKEQELERREEHDYQQLRAEFEALHEHFLAWDGEERRRQ